MPLGIVNDSDFEAEVNNSGLAITNQIPVTNPALRIPTVLPNINSNKPDMIIESDNHNSEQIVTSDVLIKRFGQGRHEGDVNVPHSLRKLIGDTANTEGRASALQLAESLNISPGSVSAYTNPEVASQLSESNKLDLTSHIKTRKNKLSKKALNKLSLAISLISEDKLVDLKARDLSAVAKDMAIVAKQMEPENKEAEKSPVQFHFYAPQVRNETHYETVVAKDNY